jgi:predicted glutamine amidotransferase
MAVINRMARFLESGALSIFIQTSPCREADCDDTSKKDISRTCMLLHARLASSPIDENIEEAASIYSELRQRPLDRQV